MGNGAKMTTKKEIMKRKEFREESKEKEREKVKKRL